MTLSRHDPMSSRAQAEIGELIADIVAAGWPDGIDEARAAFDAEGPPLACDIAVTPLSIAGRPAQRLLAPGADRARVVLYLHGGGYVYGSLASHAGLCGEVSRAAGRAVVQIDYRLAPEHPYPAAIEDATAAYRWLIGEGYRPDRIALMGDSAGAGLVMAALLALRDEGTVLPGAAVCLCPWVDLTASGESYDSRAALDPMIDRTLALKLAGLYANGVATSRPSLSPLFANLAGLPRMLIQVGEREVLQSEAADLASRARAAGVPVSFEEWPGMIHVWHLYFPRLAAGRDAIFQVGEFLRGGDALDPLAAAVPERITG
jgi:epsilon-lactone hydrolase